MKIGERLRRGAAPCFSFEFFPPKTDKGQANLFTALEELAGLDPAFVSVTYGAGGSGCDRTLDVVRRIRRDTGLEAMAHVTCLGHTRAEMHKILRHLEAAGIENLLALRGDTSNNATGSPRSADDFRFAADFVRFVRGGGYSFSVGGACYPEGHIGCPSRQLDLHHLRKKVDAGLDFLITQLFFENAFYFDFVSRARKAGVKVPIIPGIMPITNIEQLGRFTRMCGATIPMRLSLELERMQDEPEAVIELGVAHATVQCMDLLARGAPGVHFFTLNRSAATRMILTALRGWRQSDHLPVAQPRSSFGALILCHFNNPGILLVVMTLLWFYFTFAEYLTTWYGHEPMGMTVFYAKFNGPYAPMFRAMFLFCFVILFGILCRGKTSTVTGTPNASISANIGMLLERFTIVMPTLVNPRINRAG